MPKIMLNGIPYGAGGDGNLSIVEVTEEEYEALPEAEKMNENKIYHIVDKKSGVTFGNKDISKVGDGTVTGAIWSMNENLTRVANIHDARSVDETPAYYMEKYPSQVVWEFKDEVVLGIGGGFCVLLTIIPWPDSSGGYPKQLAFPNSLGGAGFYCRAGATNTTWGGWTQK